MAACVDPSTANWPCLLQFILKHKNVLETYAASALILSLLLKCSLPNTVYKYTGNCSQHSQTKISLHNCDLTKITTTAAQKMANP
jgi:hypothetical protein